MDIDVLKNIKEPVFYVTNDVGRGIGLERLLPDYHIICLDDNRLVDYLKDSGGSVFCLERELKKKNFLPRSSGLILSHPLVLNFIKERSKGKTPNILFFKPQAKMEFIAKKFKFNLIGNSTFLSNKFEDKISFFEICQQIGVSVPPGEIGIMADMEYENLVKKYGPALVFQTGQGWAGNSTFFVDSEEKFASLTKRLKSRRVKVCSFIKGKTILNNAVIFSNSVYVGKPAVQIKADLSLTSNPGGTGGRQWPAGVSSKIEIEIEKVTKKIGEIMSDCGYKGFFGLDFLIEEKTEIVFLSECNARLTASVPLFTKLELKAKAFPLLGYHLLSFLPISVAAAEDYKAPDICGGEIVARNACFSPVVVRGEFEPGTYDENFTLVKKNYFLKDLADGLCWITSVGKGRKVNPEIEILRICSLGRVCDSQGNLKEKFNEIIIKVKERLRLSPC